MKLSFTLPLLVVSIGTFLFTSNGWTKDREPPKNILYFHQKMAYEDHSGLTFSYSVEPDELSSRFSQITGIPAPVNRANWERSVIKNAIEKSVRKALINIVKDAAYLKPAGYSEEFIQLRAMIDQGLVEDLTQSKYVFKSECRDANGELKEATAQIGVRNSKICFSPKTIREHQPKWQYDEIYYHVIALTLHEHAHHFGYLDHSHRLYALIRGSANPNGSTRKGVESEVYGIPTSAELIQARNQFAILPKLLDLSLLDQTRTYDCQFESLPKGIPEHHLLKFTPHPFFNDQTSVQVDRDPPLEFSLQSHGLVNKDLKNDQFYELRVNADGKLSIEFSEKYNSNDSQVWYHVPALGSVSARYFGTAYGYGTCQ